MRTLIYTVLFSLILFSCSTKVEESIVNTEQKSLKLNIASQIKTLYPPAINDVYSMQVASQIFEGLVKFNPVNLDIEPAIAEKWEINDDFTEYTFFLRKDIFFHDNPCFPKGKGRKLTANDVKYSFNNLCSQKFTNNNFKATLLYVIGAEKYYENSLDSTNTNTNIEGIEIINDYTIKIKLKKSMPFFLNSLALTVASIYPKEAFEMYKENNFVGTGAFYLKEYPQKEKITLLKNPNYYKTDKNNTELPYIDTVFISVESSISKEINGFVNNKTDIIMNIPSSYISEFMDKHIKDFESNPPKYIVINYTNAETNDMYNITKSNIHNFSTNSMNYIDLSLVFIETPKIKVGSTNIKEKKNL